MAAKASVSATKQLVQLSKRRRNPRRTRGIGAITLVRETQPNGFSLTAGSFAGSLDPILSSVQTSDLVGMYDQYKINWVEVVFVPRFAPENSGIVNNTNLWITTACDPASQLSAPTWTQVTSYDGHSCGIMNGSKPFVYRCRPKPVNAMAAGNFGLNDESWIALSAGGIGVAHPRIYYNVRSNDASCVVPVDYMIRLSITVKQAR